MRTSVAIEDGLVRAAMQVTGLKTKRETVEEGLKTLLRLAQQREIRALRGRLVSHSPPDARWQNE